MAKVRLDVLLVERGLAESRSKAQAMIMAGQVRVADQVLLKPATSIPADSVLTVHSGPRFVSRGGEKLDAALEAFQIDVSGRICADVGASTGGFTDCLLQRGAARVYAIDVGKGILHWKLRNDPRVMVMEESNARYVESLPEPVALVTVDASFISVEDFAAGGEEVDWTYPPHPPFPCREGGRRGVRYYRPDQTPVRSRQKGCRTRRRRDPRSRDP
jgi:23S rRNA (cytidine1920-2'-O)/16S rRNA (cytidine1409-2'-O)-methyltransferase